jgi:c-di-GMP-binding flagellar brake protein YcgR
MGIADLRTGASVDILDDSSQQAIYETTIYRAGGEDSCVLKVPIAAGEIQILPQGVEYKIRFRLPDKGLFEAPFIVIEYTYSGNVMGMLIQATGEAVHVQQRQHFRMDCEIPVKCAWVDDVFKRDVFSGTIANLSGSGAKIRCSEPQVSGGVISFKLPLLDVSVPVTASIVNIKEVVTPTKSIIHCGVMFIHLSRKERDEIVRHVHHLEFVSLTHKIWD